MKDEVFCLKKKPITEEGIGFSLSEDYSTWCYRIVGSFQEEDSISM